MLKLHDEDKVKAADEKSALKHELMATITDLTTKQSGNVQVGVFSLGPKRIKPVAFQAQAASTKAQIQMLKTLQALSWRSSPSWGRTSPTESWQQQPPTRSRYCLVGGPGLFQIGISAPRYLCNNICNLGKNDQQNSNK